MRLAFVETAAQARAAPPDCTIVALEPHAQVALERDGRAFKRPQEYVAWDVLEHEGLTTFETLERLCSAIDELAKLHVPGVTEHELRPGSWHLFELKPVYDGVWLTALRLRRILDAERPDDVVWFDSRSVAARVLGVLLSSAPLPDPTPAPPPARHLRRLPRTRSLVRRLRLLIRTRDGGGLPVLLLDESYNLLPIAAQLARLGYPIRTHRAAPAGKPLDESFWTALGTDEQVRAAFVQGGVDLWPAAVPRLRSVLGVGIPRVLAAHGAARDELARVQPCVVLTSKAAVAPQKAECHAARQAGVPVLVARHGELGSRHVPMVAYQDVDSVDWALCWGRWEAEWVQRHARRPVQTRIVGAPMIEERTGRAPSRDGIRAELDVPVDARVALYVPTGLSGDDWYASSRTPDDSSYFEQKTRVVRDLAGLGLYVVVKEHTFGRPTPLDAWAEPLAGVRLIYEPPFSQLIQLPDVIVLDAPSTTLVEALFGTAPIVIVDHPVFDWQPGVRDHLLGHGVEFATMETLAAVVRAARPPDFEAAREPLISVEGEPAAVRAARAIIAIESESR